MRIIDEENKRTLSSILIMLTPDEVFELVGMLKALDPIKNDHAHLNDINYKREVTVGIYTKENLHLFKEEIRKILSED
jgi:hypothetical protein